MRKRKVTLAMLRQIRHACPIVGKGQKCRIDVGRRTDCTQNDIQVDTWDVRKWGKDIDLSDIGGIEDLQGLELEVGMCFDIYVYLPIHNWPGSGETKDDYDLHECYAATWTGTEWTVDDNYPELMTPPAHFLAD